MLHQIHLHTLNVALNPFTCNKHFLSSPPYSDRQNRKWSGKFITFNSYDLRKNPATNSLLVSTRHLIVFLEN